jgi:hypothetical protein
MGAIADKEMQKKNTEIANKSDNLMPACLSLREQKETRWYP